MEPLVSESNELCLIVLCSVSEFYCSYRNDATHGGSHRFIPRMNIEMGSSCHIGVAQQARYRCDVDAVFDGTCRKRVPLRYNKDKRKKPVFSRVSAFVVAYSIPFPTLIVNEKSVE